MGRTVLSGRVSVCDEQQSGRPVEIATSSLESCIYALIQDNRRITVELITEGVLTNKIMPAIRTKCHGLLTKAVISFHENARPLTAQLTQETLKKLRWKILPHPPTALTSPQSDFNLFGPLKQALRGKYFRFNKEVKSQVQKCFRDQLKELYARDIRKFEER